MCCPGCVAVAETIAGSGLADYYTLRTELNNTPDTELSSQFQIYDDSQVNTGFVKALSKHRFEGTLLIEGIQCAACTWLIEQALLKQAGIEKAVVNMSQFSLHVSWDSNQLKLSEIMLLIKTLGYTPHPYRSSERSELMMRQQRQSLRHLAVAGLGMMQVGMFAIALHAGDIQGIEAQYQILLRWVSFAVCSIVVFFSAQSFFINAWRSLKQKNLGMDVPVSIAIGLAYLASSWATISQQGQVYFDSVVMFTFFLLLGRYLETRARQHNLLTLGKAHDLLPDSVMLSIEGKWTSVAREQLRPGDRILISEGTIIPVDGHVISGQSSVDESAFSGEYLPRAVTNNVKIYAGTTNLESSLEICVTALADDTKLAGILRSMVFAHQQKPRIAKLADTISSYFVAAILFLALATALYWLVNDPSQALWISLSVLVVSCPCALSLATPSALTRAVYAMQRHNVIISGESALDNLNRANRVIFDKTGTLTEGKISLEKIVIVDKTTELPCLEIAAALQQHSSHPIAKAFDQHPTSLAAVEVHNAVGRGLQGLVNKHLYRIGQLDYCAEICADINPCPDPNKHWICLCDESSDIAWFEISDRLRRESAEVIRQLKSLGFKVDMLSGDPSPKGPELALQLKIDNFLCGISAEQKLQYVKQQQSAGDVVIMVGDGVNDAPVLAGADISFAVSQASGLAKSESDCLIIDNSLRPLIDTLHMAKRCNNIIKQNFSWALIYNIVAIPLAAAGFIAPYWAALGMSLSSLIVVSNSLRLK